ncbi:MAG TPA: malate synthase A, partial [Hyphomonas sp.]|nr:malate synthase A [Hyphomonas sp.]
HPGLVPIAMEEFVKVLGDRPNQFEKQVEGKFGPEQWLDFRPTTPITEAGLRNNINVGIHYLGSWLAGNGCVPIHNLMEDAATAEISRSQIWQWIHHGAPVKSAGGDMRAFNKAWFDTILADELGKVRAALGDNGFKAGRYDIAAKIFAETATSEDLPDFLTLPAYEALRTIT